MEQDSTVFVNRCPTCKLELVGDNALCACDTGALPIVTRDPMIGATIAGYYKIIDVIGRGGMGVVYHARDQLMDRAIAIKMLHAHLVHDDDTIKRFHMEAKAASSLQHQNVVVAYDFGSIKESQQPYLVMELVQGHSLADLIDKEGQLDYERAVKIFLQVCDALAHAHAKFVVHRDLKPSNIMLVTNREEPDYVKIVDFGIAKMLPQSGKAAQQLTQTGEVFGSPLYMSPEQFQGKKLDKRTDIYALGCVMYEALMGKPPFVGEHVLDTMFKHLNEQAPKFAIVRPTIKVPERIELVVMRCLEKEPDARYQSVEEVAADLRQMQKGFRDRRPLKARLASLKTKVKRLQRKYGETIYMSVICVSCVFIVVGGWFAFQLTMKSASDSQWRQLKNDGQEKYRVEDFEAALVNFSKAAKVAKDSFGEDDPRYTETLKRVAWVLESLGEYSKARNIYAKMNKLTPTDQSHVKLAQAAYAGLTMFRHQRESGAQFDAAENLLRKAIVQIDKYFGPSDPGLVPLLDELGEIYKDRKDWAEAENQYMRIISVMTETEGDNSVGAARAHVQIADLYAMWGNKEDARKSYEKAIEIYESVLGKSNSLVAETRKRMDDAEHGLIKPPDWRSHEKDMDIPQFEAPAN